MYNVWCHRLNTSSLWTKNLLSKEMWLLCGKKDHNLNLWKPFLAPKAFCDTEPRENKKKIKSSCTCIYFCVVTHRGLLQYIKLLQNVWYVFKLQSDIYIYFPINISSKGAMMTFWSLFLWRHSLINVVESSQPDSRVLTLDLITAVCFRLGWRNKRLGKWDTQIQVTGW